MIIVTFEYMYYNIPIYFIMIGGKNVNKKVNSTTHKKTKLFIILGILLFIIIYLLITCIPYLIHPKISTKTSEDFDINSFYSDSPSSDRAMILSTNEDALTERLRLIKNAKESIVMSTFSVNADTRGKKILAALYDAADRGVNIQILIDGFSYFKNSKCREYFTALGSLDNVTIKIYNPINILKPNKLMARMHDKYLIIDNQTYIIGGRNINSYFLGYTTGFKTYDWDMLIHTDNVKKSSSIHQITDYFNSIWNSKYCKVKCDNISSLSENKVKKAKKELKELFKQTMKENPDWFEPIDYNTKTVATNNIKLLSNPINPSVKEPTLFYNMTELMKESKNDVFFHTPYIISDNYMRDRLSKACNSSKSITMMTNSIANNANPFGATDYKLNKDKILKTGVNILEFDNGTSYHGKCFTIGNKISAVGSFNWDMRSTYIDTELMLVVDSEELNSIMRTYMLQYENDALIVNEDGSYSLKENQTIQEVPDKQKKYIKLLGPISKLLRFLM